MNEVFFRFDDLDDRVTHLADMIDARTEVKAKFLGKAKTELENILQEHYDHNSPESAIRWAKHVMRRVDHAKIALQRARRMFGENLPQTEKAHQCAANMVAKIGRRIQRAEKYLTERV